MKGVNDRVIEEGRFIAENNATVRSCAAAFGIGKSTVHYDVTKKLKRVDEELYHRVKEVLCVNLSERHVRGGLSTKKMYEKKKNPRLTNTGK